MKQQALLPKAENCRAVATITGKRTCFQSHHVYEKLAETAHTFFFQLL
jgi:hypothetical protein